MSLEKKNHQVCGSSSPKKLYQEVMSHLEKTFSLPPDGLEQEVEEVERGVARLRDCLIDNLRHEQHAGQSRWRKPLNTVNVALAYVASVAFPTTGIHKSYMEQAKDVLAGMEGDLPESE